MKIVLISANTYPGDQGLRTISGYLKKNGYDVKMVFMVLSENYDEMYNAEMLEQLKWICRDAKLIGVSSMASTSKRARQIIDYLKVLETPIVYGGVHCTISPEEAMKVNNIICVGEGEEAMLELANAVKSGRDYSKIKNLIVNERRNDVRVLEEDLDKYGYQDYDIENHYIIENGRLVNFQEKHFNGMIFYQGERGCPHACTYCINKKFKTLYHGKGKILRTLSVDFMINDLKRITSRFKSIKTIDLRDETWFVRPLENIEEFCDRYKNEIGLRLKCLGSPPTMDYEKLRLMVDSGLTDIIIGIQSGSDRVNRDIYRRFITKEQVLSCASIVNRFKGRLNVMYDMITTNPYEENEDVLDSIKIMMNIPKPYYLSVNNLVFFYGSELYEMAVSDGVIKGGKDSASDLNYWDRWKHIKLKKKNAYLNLVFNLMRGKCNNWKYGIMPSFILKILINKRMIWLNDKLKFTTYVIGSFVGMFDFLRENLVKPVYRRMPSGFKNWFDRIRYRA